MEQRVGASARRAALASRRAARETDSNASSPHRNDAVSTPEPSRTISIHESNDDNWRRKKRVPLQNNLLASLSRALTNIDRQNGEQFDGRRQEHVAVNHTHEEKRQFRKVTLNPPSDFGGYLRFNRASVQCLLGFATCYLLVVICCYPMITTTTSDGNGRSTIGDAELQRGASFQNVRGRKAFLRVKQELGTMKERAIQWEEDAKVHALEKIEDVLESSTVGRKDGKDALMASKLLEEAVDEFEKEAVEEEKRAIVAERIGSFQHDHWEDSLKSWDEEAHLVVGANKAESNEEIYRSLHGNKTPGFMVLGMHRSGTSMLSGLLVKGFGYETGGPLIGAAFDNEKGFYERIDVVLQNDEFFSAQHMGWSFNVYHYDSEKALRHKQEGTITFNEGKKAIRFLNNPHKELPYLQKDPRMCIALPTWLELLDHPPAIVFTYRHPLEVAMSLKKREEGFTLEHGLRLWIVYNMRALQNSAKLCRVFSTNEALVKDPMSEVQRIADELTTKCNVIAPPNRQLAKSVVDEFVDPKLQHNKEKPGGRKIREGCIAPQYQSEHAEGSPSQKQEEEIFLMAMEVFCDLESGDALKEGYGWPDLETMKWPLSKVH
ncbi:hypothetical protein HJC23_012605 [Cyclotella cryptica]|uniref:Protein-tyrosine sulfotransferase n=1 Tax=Cyclotella cryptica TaxID=29204 RepID=A0ABD3QLD1_9STRA|eukprot:CCRYP_004141-RA/>CCRYP_004141-RA protein AED:0.12 eAED:0.12 QI:458/1/1/1/0.33/0.25/4/1931/603